MSGNTAAQQAATAFVDKFNDIILFPLITLLMAVALLVFLWGVFEYISGSASDEARKKGRVHMLWGIIGLLIMISALSILNIALGTFGLDTTGNP